MHENMFYCHHSDRMLSEFGGSNVIFPFHIKLRQFLTHTPPQHTSACEDCDRKRCKELIRQCAQWSLDM